MLDVDAYFLDWSQHSIWFVPLGLIMCFAVSFPLGSLPWVQRSLTAKKDQEADVYHRAELEFYRGRYNRTRGQTAVIVFISLTEKKAVILADKKVADALPSDTWSKSMAAMRQPLRNKDVAGAFVAGINSIVDSLAEKFPFEKALEQNEICNHLVVKE